MPRRDYLTLTGMKAFLWTLIGGVMLVLGSHAVAARKDRMRDRCNKTVDIYEGITTPAVTLSNRGKPLYCFYKFRVSPPRNDWIISVRFHRMKVGRLTNSSTCSRGYLQIIDGNDSTVVSNRRNPGVFCGEIDEPQTYISESSFVKIVFFTESFSEETYIAFDSRAEQQFELYARYGPNPQLYPDRRGKLIQGTFCDRVFDDCRLGTCYVQSPGFPGVYPRNLRCKYFLRTSSLYIRPFLENEEIKIDGRRCADMIVCPMNTVTTRCPSDYLRIYDGPSESSPVIGKFCGAGKFPYALTGTGKDLLVVFVSSAAGPLLNVGFHFNVGPNPMWVGPGASKQNNSCSHVFRSEDNLDAEKRRFYSLSTWYTPNTTCNFLIVGKNNEIVRLYFKTFRVQRPKHGIIQPPRDCAESLAVYDSQQPDEARVVAIFCDTWAAPVPETKDFVSSSPVMLVQFKSLTGSYAGSSLTFWGQFDFFNAYKHGQAVPQTFCDEVYSSSVSSTGIFSSPLNRLVFKRKDSLECVYYFEGGMAPFQRVFLTLFSVKFGYSQRPCHNCLLDPVDKIIIREISDNTTETVCICNGSSKAGNGQLSRLTFISLGPKLELRQYYDGEYVEYNYFHNKIQIFQGSYEFFHGPLCGPAVLQIQNQGELVYPYPNEENGDYRPSSPVRCIWVIHVTPHKDVFLWFDYLQLPGNCSSDRIEIRLPGAGSNYADDAVIVICGDDHMVELPIINSTNMAANKMLVELRVSPSPESRFRLMWTEVMQREKQSEYFLKLGMEDCPFLCHGSNVCIPADLVCNGVRNCPKPQLDSDVDLALDEADDLCGSNGVRMNWLALGLGIGGGFFFALCVLCSIKKCPICCRRKRRSTPE